MTRINIHEIERDLHGTLRRVEEGETLVVIRDEQAVAEIKPVFNHSQAPRPYGLCQGQFSVPDDFDAPLPERVVQEFEGE